MSFNKDAGRSGVPSAGNDQESEPPPPTEVDAQLCSEREELTHRGGLWPCFAPATARVTSPALLAASSMFNFLVHPASPTLARVELHCLVPDCKPVLHRSLKLKKRKEQHLFNSWSRSWRWELSSCTTGWGWSRAREEWHKATSKMSWFSKESDGLEVDLSKKRTGYVCVVSDREDKEAMQWLWISSLTVPDSWERLPCWVALLSGDERRRLWQKWKMHSSSEANHQPGELVTSHGCHTGNRSVKHRHGSHRRK